MRFSWIFGGLALAGAALAAGAAGAAPRTYSYVVSHRTYGVIGTYDQTIDEAGGVTRATSTMRIVVRILGLAVHRESAEQLEVWQGDRLLSFKSATTINGKRLAASGLARDGRFMVTTAAGTVEAPADVAASDPRSLNRLGAGIVVSIKTGQIDTVEVTGGEADRVKLQDVAVRTRHFHVNTPAQANKWEVWLDHTGLPIKFRSLEKAGAIDFTLASPPPLVVGEAGTRSDP